MYVFIYLYINMYMCHVYSKITRVDLIIGGVGGSETSFQGFSNFFLFFLSIYTFSHSVHTVFTTVQAKF